MVKDGDLNTLGAGGAGRNPETGGRTTGGTGTAGFAGRDGATGGCGTRPAGAGGGGAALVTTGGLTTGGTAAAGAGGAGAWYTGRGGATGSLGLGFGTTAAAGLAGLTRWAPTRGGCAEAGGASDGATAAGGAEFSSGALAAAAGVSALAGTAPVRRYTRTCSAISSSTALEWVLCSVYPTASSASRMTRDFTSISRARSFMRVFAIRMCSRLPRSTQAIVPAPLIAPGRPFRPVPGH